jgi:hypothetical protein
MKYNEYIQWGCLNIDDFPSIDKGWKYNEYKNSVHSFPEVCGVSVIIHGIPEKLHFKYRQ